MISHKQQAYAAGNWEAPVHAVRVYFHCARTLLLFDLAVHRGPDFPRWPARCPKGARIRKRHSADADDSAATRRGLEGPACSFFERAIRELVDGLDQQV